MEPAPPKKPIHPILWVTAGLILGAGVTSAVLLAVREEKGGGPVEAGAIEAITQSAMEKYIRRSKTTEATMNVRKLFDAAVAYYEEEHASKTGVILPKQFPASTPMWPPGSPCDHPGKKYPANPTRWQQHPTWNALNFGVDDPHYYRYQFVSTGSGTKAAFTARAIGDLNCDGKWSTFERIGSADNHGNISGGSGLYKNNPLE
jgi:hypothetical protein